MRKANKIIMAIVSTLLTLTLVSSCILSGLYAKYVTKESSSATVSFKKFGVTITHGTDLNTQYDTSARDGIVEIKVNTGDSKLIAPGTRGALVWFRVKGSPEVAYSVDFSGSIDIGDGYTSYIEDANGNAIEYFPIRFRYVAYDVSTDGGEEVLKKVDALTSPLITVKRTDVWGNEHYFDDNALDSIDVLETFMNSNTDMGINMALDEPFQAPGVSIDRIYALEWEWLYHYDTEEEVDAGKTENNREATAEGNYQTRELDTKLGEAIIKNPTDFYITLDMDITVKQVVDGLPYELFEENGVKKIKFGSYPQSLVSDSDLATTLSSKAGTLPTADEPNNWTSYGYYQNGSNSEDYMWYIDVEDGGEKYRGVYFISAKPNTNYDRGTDTRYYQAGRGYVVDTVYWFKYEPITWTIIEETSRETAFLVCDMIIDAQSYQNTYNPFDSAVQKPRYNSLDGEDYKNPYGYSRIYANNYEYSTIRKWLNETFYETAFSELDDLFILDTYVNNGIETTPTSTLGGKPKPEQYASKNTIDKMFLLSYSEVANADYNLKSIRSVTEYAKAQGGYADKSTGDGYWWLRSFYCNPSSDYYNNSWYSIRINNNGGTGIVDVGYNYIGVVPALWIKL